MHLASPASRRSTRWTHAASSPRGGARGLPGPVPESGLLIGFLLPGDSLLSTAGLLWTTAATATVHLSLPAVLVAATGALTGAQVGYLLGRRIGPRLLDRPDRPRLQHGVHRARAALDRYGATNHRDGPVHPTGAHRAEPASCSALTGW